MIVEVKTAEFVAGAAGVVVTLDPFGLTVLPWCSLVYANLISELEVRLCFGGGVTLALVHDAAEEARLSMRQIAEHGRVLRRSAIDNPVKRTITDHVVGEYVGH